MVRFSDDAEKVTSAQPGEYLFKIYEVNEKTSQAGNDYWQVKFETKEGVKVCDNFMFFGKAASKTLSLLTALGLADGENFPTEEEMDALLTSDNIEKTYRFIGTTNKYVYGDFRQIYLYRYSKRQR